MKLNKQLLVALCLLLPTVLFAQNKCELPRSITCIDHDPLFVKRVLGKVGLNQKRTRSKSEHEFRPLGDACVSIYTVEGEKLVSSARSKKNGKFIFRKIPDGTYWLVARDDVGFLTPARIRIKVGNNMVDGKIKINLVTKEIDSCSWADLEVKILID